MSKLVENKEDLSTLEIVSKCENIGIGVTSITTRRTIDEVDTVEVKGIYHPHKGMYSWFHDVMESEMIAFNEINNIVCSAINLIKSGMEIKDVCNLLDKKAMEIEKK